MNNIIVIAYNGKRPTQQQIEALAQRLATLKCCDEVEVIQHYDKKSIVDIIGKGTTLIGFEPKEDEALKNAATFINSNFNSAWDMIAKAAVSRKAIIRSEEDEALLNAIDIIASNKAENCEKYGIPSIMHNACYNIKYHILNID